MFKGDLEGALKGGLQRRIQRGLQTGLTWTGYCCQAQVGSRSGLVQFRFGPGQVWSRSGSVYSSNFLLQSLTLRQNDWFYSSFNFPNYITFILHSLLCKENVKIEYKNLKQIYNYSRQWNFRFIKWHFYFVKLESLNIYSVSYSTWLSETFEFDSRKAVTQLHCEGKHYAHVIHNRDRDCLYNCILLFLFFSCLVLSLGLVWLETSQLLVTLKFLVWLWRPICHKKQALRRGLRSCSVYRAYNAPMSKVVISCHKLS